MAPIRRDLVVIGASAGGVEALRAVMAGLPEDFPAAVLVTLHLGVGRHSALPQILDRSGLLPAVPARHGAALRPGTVYAAPPDRHLLTDDGILVLTKGPTENGHRPAVNATFRSAALTAGPRVIGVILSGTLDDGAAGLRVIVDRGGLAVIQDPMEALYAGMPENALARVKTAHVLPSSQIGPALDKLVREPVEEPSLDPAPQGILLEDRIARDGARLGALVPGDDARASGYTCPDCQGRAGRDRSGRPVSVPHRPRLVGRGAAGRARKRVRACAGARPARARREGGTGDEAPAPFHGQRAFDAGGPLRGFGQGRR